MNEIYETYECGTTTNNQNTANVCVGELLQIHRQLHDSFINSFMGIPVRVDTNLKGNRFYCAISQEMFDEIKEKIPIKMG